MKFWFTLLLLTVMSRTAYAESLTKEQAVAEAFRNNPELNLYRSELQSVETGARSILSLPGPEIELALSSESSGGNNRIAVKEARLTQEFFLPGTYSLKTKRIERQKDLHRALLDIEWSRIYAEVVEQYFKVALNRELVNIERKRQSLVGLLVARTAVLYSSGSIRKNALDRVQVELKRVESDLMRAEAALGSDARKLSLLIGVTDSVAMSVAPLSQLSSNGVPGATVLDSLGTTPQHRHDSIQMAIADVDYRLECMARNPTPFLGIGREEEDGRGTIMAVLGLSLPAWNWNKHAIAQAMAERENKRLAAANTRARLRNEYRNLINEAILNRKRIALLTDAQRVAEDMVRLANQQRIEGELDFVQYLDQMMSLIEVKRDLALASFEYQVAKARLESLTITTTDKGAGQ